MWHISLAVNWDMCELVDSMKSELYDSPQAACVTRHRPHFSLLAVAQPDSEAGSSAYSELHSEFSTRVSRCVIDSI